MCLGGLVMGCFCLTQILTFKNCSLVQTAAPDPENVLDLVAIYHWANTFQVRKCYS